jgi:hypothetical protein
MVVIIHLVIPVAVKMVFVVVELLDYLLEQILRL